jgi:hypothetical protein
MGGDGIDTVRMVLFGFPVMTSIDAGDQAPGSRGRDGGQSSRSSSSAPFEEHQAMPSPNAARAGCSN